MRWSMGADGENASWDGFFLGLSWVFLEEVLRMFGDCMGTAKLVPCDEQFLLCRLFSI